MRCPLYKVRAERFYRVNQFITPDESSVYNKARELTRYYENKIEACFNFVSIIGMYQTKSSMDMKNIGHFLPKLSVVGLETVKILHSYLRHYC